MPSEQAERERDEALERVEARQNAVAELLRYRRYVNTERNHRVAAETRAEALQALVQDAIDFLEMEPDATDSRSHIRKWLDRARAALAEKEQSDAV